MFKLYNTKSYITSNLAIFLKVFPYISKPHLKLFPTIIFGIIQSESVVTSDIVKKLKDSFFFVSPSSTIRRLERSFNNPKYYGYFRNSLFVVLIRTIFPKFLVPHHIF